MAGIPVPAHMQGIPFLGDQQGEPRDAVFAARDRVDESYDMIRSVRTKDYLYICNYYPNEPFSYLGTISEQDAYLQGDAAS